jgi:hypothetical protein
LFSHNSDNSSSNNNSSNNSNNNIDMFVRRYPFAFLVLVCFALYIQSQLTLLDSIQVDLEESRNDLYWVKVPIHDTSNLNTRIHNEHEAIEEQQPHLDLGSWTKKGNDESADSDPDDDGVSTDAKSMDGVDSTHMARDGAWVHKLANMLNCDRIDDGKTSFVRIPTKETWYVQKLCGTFFQPDLC